MVYVPSFMNYLDEYNKQKRNIHTVDDWVKFRNEWFDESQWPLKTPFQLTEESLRKRGPKKIAGRLWVYTTYMYDISPEARYEFFSALYNIGHPLLFNYSGPKTAENGWNQNCPYCEISTNEIGDDTCPVCTRKLLYSRVMD
ncbi:hypothetical protein [Lutispora sp.]|uniref:hypothetical protein n=1 Tax=Lutispora sp. TaxID=2828727 RepID=UPI0035657E99